MTREASALKTEEGTMSHEMQEASGSCRNKGQILPYNFQKEPALPSPYFRTSDLQNGEIMKPLSLW